MNPMGMILPLPDDTLLCLTEDNMKSFHFSFHLNLGKKTQQKTALLSTTTIH